MEGTDDAERGPQHLFAGHPEGLALCRLVQDVVSALGDDVTTATTRSQVSFRRRRGFAYVWRPGQYVASDVPAVLSLALDHELRSERFKEVAHPAPRVWMHHLELRGPGDVDDEVRAWLAAAYAGAGRV